MGVVLLVLTGLEAYLFWFMPERHQLWLAQFHPNYLKGWVLSRAYTWFGRIISTAWFLLILLSVTIVSQLDSINVGPVSFAVALVGLSMVVGAVSAAPVLTPPLRRILWRHWQMRWLCAGLFGLLAVIICMVFFSWLGAEGAFSITYGALITQLAQTKDGQIVNLMNQFTAYRSPITTELWLRFLTPPPWRPSCYAFSAEVCRLTDEIQGVFELDYGILLIRSSIAAIIAVALTRLWSRPPREPSA